MPNVNVLDVRLYGNTIGTLTQLPGDSSIFTFTDRYVADENRPTLSLSFKDAYGNLLTRLKPVRTRVMPYFSNLLPEGHLRRYLADRAGVKEEREFFMLWMLGRDLPGALSIHPAEGEQLPPDAAEPLPENARANAYRFSLAGVQLKFSALRSTGRFHGLTIPAEGVGGSWIVKLPSMQYVGMPENEFSMMTIAKIIGMDVPEINLVDIDAIDGMPEGIGELKGQALAVRRFDRSQDGPVHTEDFAQVFGVFPHEKYDKASYTSIGRIIGIETGHAGIAEYIRRLVFNALIGNGDMHLKNWSFIYPDKRSPALSPAYDLLSTIPYVPGEDTAALNYYRTKRMAEFNGDELRALAAKAHLPEKIVIDAASETVRRFRDAWEAEKNNLPMTDKVKALIEKHAPTIPLYDELK